MIPVKVKNTELEINLSSLSRIFHSVKYFILFLSLSYLLYGGSLGNKFIWDDLEQIANNPMVDKLENIPTFFKSATYWDPVDKHLKGAYYRPLSMAYYTLIVNIFGKKEFFFHLIQIFIHGINVFLIFVLFKRMFQGYLPLMLSLIFLVHPINSEAVVFVASHDVLFTLFGLIGLHICIKKSISNRRILFWGICMLISILFKEAGFIFILFTVLYKLLFNRKDLIKIITIGIITTLIWGILRYIIADISSISLSPNHMTILPLYKRLIQIPSIFLFYLRTYFFPNQLSLAQTWTIEKPDFSGFWLPLFILMFVNVVLIFIGVRIRSKNRAEGSLYIFWLTWFIFSTAIHFQIFPLYLTVADRWFYVPEIGLLGLLGVIINRILPKIHRVTKVFFMAVFITVITLFSIRVYIRVGNWKDGLTIYGHDSRITDSYIIENNLSNELFQINNISEAQYHAEKATRLAPFHMITWQNLGNVYQKEGKISQAVESYNQAIALGHPALSYEKLSIIYLLNKDYASVFPLIKEGLIYHPFDGRLWLFLAIVQYQSGRIPDAKDSIDNAILYNNSSIVQKTKDAINLSLPLNLQY